MACRGCGRKRGVTGPRARSTVKGAGPQLKARAATRGANRINPVTVRVVLLELFLDGDPDVVKARYNGTSGLAHSTNNALFDRFGLVHYGATKTGQVIPILRGDIDDNRFTLVEDNTPEEAEEVEEVEKVEEPEEVETEPTVVFDSYPEDLPEVKRMAYKLLITDKELTYSEISEMSGLSVNQVKYIKTKYKL